MSRWEIGHPPIMIDLPGEPQSGGVEWSDQRNFGFFPSAWKSEGGGARVEIARIYAQGSPQEVLSGIGSKLGIPMSPQSRGEISFRPYVLYSGSGRTVLVAGPDSGNLGGSTWAVVITYNNQSGAAIANAVLDSIVFEREGRENWVIRSLGSTRLLTELPFDLAPTGSQHDTELQKRYELHFSGMEVKVLQEQQAANSKFDVETTMKGIIESNRSRPGIKDFVLSRGKTKMGEKREADLLTMSFKEGYRSYKILEMIVIVDQVALLTTITTDPTRQDHREIADRIFNKLRLSSAIITGWKPFAVGQAGLYLDLPKAPEAGQLSNGVLTYSVFTGPMAVDVRETTYFGNAYDPDFASKQMLEILKAQIGKPDTTGTIEKRMIDGLESRLLRTTFKNAGFLDHRDRLLIYSTDRFWMIDAIAADAEKDYLERIIESARVQLPLSQKGNRQPIGQMGVSFVVSGQPLKVTASDTPNDPDIIHQETVQTTQLDGNIVAVIEMTLTRQLGPLTNDLANTFAQQFIGGLSQSSPVKLTARLKDSFPIKIDNVGGLHQVYEITANNGNKAQGDIVTLVRDKQMWTVIVMANVGTAEGRTGRARILNTLRVGY